MRLVYLACTLLLAIAACAQSTPMVPAAGQQSQIPSWNGPSAANRRLCYSIVTIHGHPRESFPLNEPLPRSYVTTCTPANRFRAEYIPNATLHRDAVPAHCPDCATLPKGQPAPDVQQVRQSP